MIYLIAQTATQRAIRVEDVTMPIATQPADVTTGTIVALVLFSISMLMAIVMAMRFYLGLHRPPPAQHPLAVALAPAFAELDNQIQEVRQQVVDGRRQLFDMAAALNDMRSQLLRIEHCREQRVEPPEATPTDQPNHVERHVTPP